MDPRITHEDGSYPLWHEQGLFSAVPKEEEVLRYLGIHGEIQDPLDIGRVEQCMDRCTDMAEGRYSASIARSNSQGELIMLEGTIVDLDRSWFDEPIQGADGWAIFACTLGTDIDGMIARLGATDPVEQLIFDSCASSAAETVADACEARIAEICQQYGLFAGQRLSPGYGRVPLDLSCSLSAALDTMRGIGLSSTAEGRLYPSKSITALVPLFEEPKRAAQAHRSCCDCISREGCALLKAGTPCYQTKG